MSAYLHSLNDAEYEQIFLALAQQPLEIQKQEMKRLMASSLTERDKDAARKRSTRSKAAEIWIPDCVNPRRRERALLDPERFLMTYFPDRYSLRFGPHHQRMIAAIVDCATNGTRQAIAAPRGCGKSEIVKGLNVYLMLACIVRFPVIVAATRQLAKRLFDDFRQKLSLNDLLYADFPEVCAPVRALEGAPQRASRQHIDGQLTNIIWTSTDYVRLPDVPHSPYGGMKMAYFGLDAAFRGCNINGDRPDFGTIDDPETKESAASEMQIEGREETIDRDITGLKGQASKLGLVMLTTVQNTICLSFKFTDPKLKPPWNGLRFGSIVKWPTNMELWDEYVSTRQRGQSLGDAQGKEAIEFYLANRTDMDLGAEMLTDFFVPVQLDGYNLVYSSLQLAFNQISDTSLDAFRSEYQNNPTPEDAPDTTGLTAGRVASRISGLSQGEYHTDTELVTVGLDIGKYYSHWCKVAWHGNAVGNIVDYGVMETPGMMAATDSKAVMSALLPALLQFRTDIAADGRLDFCLVDSGDYSDAVYEFKRRIAGSPFAPSKGWDQKRFRIGKDEEDKNGRLKRKTFLECYAKTLDDDPKMWLYHVNTEYWKQWLQERFVTATFDESQQFNAGSLSLFAVPEDRKRHLSFSHHMVSEERRDSFVPGKGMVRKWVTLSKNNHYLDACALACAAAGCMGVRIIPKQENITISQQISQTRRPAITNPYGRPFLATERK